MKARIRYLAFLSDTPAALAGFCARQLDFDEVARSADGDVTVTDGFFNVGQWERAT